MPGRAASQQMTPPSLSHGRLGSPGQRPSINTCTTTPFLSISIHGKYKAGFSTRHPGFKSPVASKEVDPQKNVSQDECTTNGTYVCTFAARLFLSGRVTWNMLFSPKLMTCARRAAQIRHMLDSSIRAAMETSDQARTGTRAAPVSTATFTKPCAVTIRISVCSMHMRQWLMRICVQ